MACLRLKPTSDAPLPQGLPAKIIRLHRSGRRAKAHISMKPDNFRRLFPELAEGRCAFSGAWSPLPRWRKPLVKNTRGPVLAVLKRAQHTLYLS
jgi:hypothetical protein